MSDYTVYCDESRHSPAPCNEYMAIGGLWVPTGKKAELTKQLRNLVDLYDINSELKWSKVSRLKLDAYKSVIDFFTHSDVRFRVIIVEQAKLDYALHKEGNAELGFYTFYYEMLVKWLEPDRSYNLLLDFKKNKGYGHLETLQRCLQTGAPLGARVTGVHSIDSADSPLAQLSDILTGATAASWCGIQASTPKAELAAHIAKETGKQSLRLTSNYPKHEKLNIFNINLR